jgi:uncharacterized protein (DUF885 family)
VKTIALFLCTLGAAHADTAMVDRFFDEYYFRFNPTQGTSAGFHQYDTKLEDYSRAAVRERGDILRRFESEFEKQPASDDRDLILGKIRSDLLELDNIRQWEKNPDTYSGGVTSSVFVIMSRNFAPAPERLKAVIARERQMSAVFDAARANLKNPPRIYTEVAIEQLPGIVSFFEKDVPSAFAQVQDADLLADFKKSNAAVIAALQSYEKFLKDDLLPRSKGDFRIGADNYRKKLAYDEMADTPLDELLKMGYADMRNNQEQFRKVAAGINPKRTPAQLLDDLQKDHPAPSNLLQSVRDVLSGLRDFITSHQIIDIPSPVPPIIEETPPFMRALTFASMDTPGPYERVAKEAFFNITLPEQNWPKAQIEEHMAGFNRGTIISTAIHEAYPGHYVQFLWVQQISSKVRKLLGCGSNAEGWAHYTEQMMLDEGYGGGDPKLRLGQLQDALLRNARYIVGIEMHTGRMTFEQGVDFFVKEGYQTRANGERETKRGTSDPTYLVYTLGKLQIMKLREDYKKMRGDQFTLREFHNNFMKQGFPPIQLVRRALLSEKATN